MNFLGLRILINKVYLTTINSNHMAYFQNPQAFKCLGKYFSLLDCTVHILHYVSLS